VTVNLGLPHGSKIHGMRIFGNKNRRRIFGPDREEATGGWRTLLNGKLYNFHSSSNFVRVI
jgi:hypothetical protein